MTPSLIPIRPFVPTADGLHRLWAKFNANRHVFPDDLPIDPIAFVCWIAADGTRVFEVGAEANPIGVFVFTNIEAKNSAWAHIYIWDTERYPPGDLAWTARAACEAILRGFDLARINGMTPVTHPHAREFAIRVGFKIEGRVRDACVVQGARCDAWLSGLLLGDLVDSAGDRSALTPSDKMDLAAKSAAALMEPR